jgi:hypothetical protein
MNHVILSYHNLIVVSSVMTKRKKTDEIYRMKLGNNHCVILLGVISSSDRNCSSSLSRYILFPKVAYGIQRNGGIETLKLFWSDGRLHFCLKAISLFQIGKWLVPYDTKLLNTSFYQICY